MISLYHFAVLWNSRLLNAFVYGSFYQKEEEKIFDQTDFFLI